ncbi:MAG: glycosyltransferase family 2 protein [Sphingobacteriaceae bacterium]|jgi:GT2 family glycosyltransferase
MYTLKEKLEKQKIMVSIITINYNQNKVTCELLESLKNTTYKNIEVIVVDNNSNTDPVIIKEKYPFIKLIKSDTNLGYAGGNNLGLKYAHGEYIIFINNDVEVEPNFIEPLLAFSASSINIGAVSPKIKYFENKSIIQYAGTQPVNPFTLRNKHIGSGYVDNGQYDTIKKTAYAHGACMMVAKMVIDHIGVMDEQFFLYYEEQDWCERMNKYGYVNYMVPNSQVYHKESITTGKNSTLKTYYLSRNRILFARKNLSTLNLFISYLYLILISIPKNTLENFNNKNNLTAYYKGIIWNLTNKSIKYGNI